MASYIWPAKDPQETDMRHLVWCDVDGTNTGAAADDGELQGATITTSTWTVPTGITKVSDSKGILTVKGVTYGINTATTITLSGGTADVDYGLTNNVVLSDGRILERSVTLPVRTL